MPQTKRPAAAAARPAGQTRKKQKAQKRPKDDGAADRTMWQHLGKIARDISSFYSEGCAFPKWSVDELSKGALVDHMSEAVVYYPEGADRAKVNRLAQQREPVNIGMERYYDEDALEERFGYRHGAYAESTKDALMPNIAIYCRTPIRSAGEQRTVHVINVIGYGFDSKEQPDYQYFFPLHTRPEKWDELVARMSQMWRYAFECAKRHNFKRVYLSAVGGGNFSGGANGLDKYESTCYDKLRDASLGPVQEQYPGIKALTLERIPDWAFGRASDGLLEDSLLVNAWDPWSMVGNGNAMDNSLDGFFGRCTAMAVLCWPETNPFIRYEAVKP